MQIDRREFLKYSLRGAGGVVLSSYALSRDLTSAQEVTHQGEFALFQNREVHPTAEILAPSEGHLVAIQGNYQIEPKPAKALITRHFPENTDRTILARGVHDLRRVENNRMSEIALATWGSEGDPFKRNISIIDVKAGKIIRDKLFDTDRILSEALSLSADGSRFAFSDFEYDEVTRTVTNFVAMVDISPGSSEEIVRLPIAGAYDPQFHPTNPDVLLFNEYHGDIALIKDDTQLKEMGIKPKQIKEMRTRLASSGIVPSQIVQPLIVTCNINDLNSRQEIGEGMQGQWSPDGTMIACSYRSDNTPSALIESRVFDSHKKDEPRLRITDTADPQWSSDSSVISCVRSGIFQGKSVKAVSFCDVKTGTLTHNWFASFDRCDARWVDSNWVFVTGDWDGNAFPYVIVLGKDGTSVFAQPNVPRGDFEKGFGFVVDVKRIHLPIARK